MKKVLVTGVSGYIGTHCAAELLKQGYKVKGTLRSLSKAEQVTRAVEAVVDPNRNLEFCELNLMKDEGWQEAMQGCDYVLHVASPFVTSQPKDENELIKPAVEGTLRALNAAKNAGVKRVVLTSSMVAMLEDVTGNIDINKDSWTQVDAPGVSAYLKSKTLAEQSAWDFIEKQTGGSRLELVTIHPGPVYGPSLTGDLSGESMSTFSKLVAGQMPMLPKVAINISDVRDVAKIHVLALENDKADGQRFIVATQRSHTFQEMAQILQDNGYEKVSTRVAPSFFLKFMANFNRDLKGMLPYIGNTFNGDVSEAMSVFDWTPIELKNTVLDTAKSLE
jgi:dihydroflavonol-4-reductase